MKKNFNPILSLFVMCGVLNAVYAPQVEGKEKEEVFKTHQTENVSVKVHSQNILVPASLQSAVERALVEDVPSARDIVEGLHIGPEVWCRTEDMNIGGFGFGAKSYSNGLSNYYEYENGVLGLFIVDEGTLGKAFLTGIRTHWGSGMTCYIIPFSSYFQKETGNDLARKALITFETQSDGGYHWLEGDVREPLRTSIN